MLTRQSARLAIDGGKPAVTGPMWRFDTIGTGEMRAVLTAMARPLSGFLGGELHGGYHVQKLERAWEETFQVKHAITCNSGTSGLLLACMAARVGRDSEVVVPAYTMSASAAAPAFLGAKIIFVDIEEETFSIAGPIKYPDITIAVNLFGHPAYLSWLRGHHESYGTILIEDNAQAIFATEGGRYAGTIGHIGVFSGNVHKLLQCGEGGICVTNDDTLAHRMRLGLNHAELSSTSVGLNLRMTEVTAAIALEQLRKGKKIVAERREIAETIIDAAKPLLDPPFVRTGCTHSYYMIAWKVKKNRPKILDALKAEGVPVKAGYVTPLYRLPAFQGEPLPVTEQVESEIITYENCAWSPTSEQLKQFREAFEKVADANQR